MNTRANGKNKQATNTIHHLEPVRVLMCVKFFSVIQALRHVAMERRRSLFLIRQSPP